MKQISEAHRGVNGKFRALTSLNQEEYEQVLPVFSDLVSKKMSQYTLKNKRREYKVYRERKDSSLYGPIAKLDFLLMYLKENANQIYHAQMFEMCQSKVSEWVGFLLPVLEESLSKLGFMPQTGSEFVLENPDNEDFVVIDVTERRVPRKTDYEAQKEEYSGKKKTHTMKNLALTNTAKKILYLSESFEGKTHDKTILDQISLDTEEIAILADLGFLGMEEDYETAITPFKKPKNGELTDLQKQINQGISKVRVGVEHAFSGVKIIKIIRNKIRLKGWNVRHRVMMIGAALHNLRLG